MGRPRKNPDDPKWQNVGSSEKLPTFCIRCGEVNLADPHTCTPPFLEEWKLYYAAALTGLIAKGGASMDSLLKTAMQYADEAVKATEVR